MKNRNLNHKDHWATPKEWYDKWNKIYNFNFDPCPLNHDTTKWDGLKIDWKSRCYINPGYSLALKTAFVIKAIEQSKKGVFCFVLLPNSTSGKLYHKYIKPNQYKREEFVEGRIPFIGMNDYGQKINYPKPWGDGKVMVPNKKYNPLDPNNPEFIEKPEYIRQQGQHDSMIVIFKERKKYHFLKPWN